MAAGKPASHGAGDQSEVDEGNVVEVTFSDLAEQTNAGLRRR
jgi:hypothetical protein